MFELVFSIQFKTLLWYGVSMLLSFSYIWKWQHHVCSKCFHGIFGLCILPSLWFQWIIQETKRKLPVKVDRAKLSRSQVVAGSTFLQTPTSFRGLVVSISEISVPLITKVATSSSANTKVNQNNILESKSNAHHATAQPCPSTAFDSSHLEITSDACTVFGNHAVHANSARMECSTTADVSEFMIQSVFEYKRLNSKLLPLLQVCSDQAQLAMTPPYLQVCDRWTM